MQDGVNLELKGIPAVVLVTKPFDTQAKSMASIMGLPNYEYALIDHPMGSLNKEEVMRRAEVALPQVLRQLVV